MTAGVQNLFIDLTEGSSELRPLAPADLILGGRALTLKLAQDLVPPGSDPLGPANILVFAAGPLAGAGISSAGRLSVGGKSPLTGGIKEANAGGTAGDSLARLGLRSVVLTGSRPAGDWAVVLVDERGARLEAARDLVGLGNYALAERVKERYGDGYTLISIGQAGELRYLSAGVSVTDLEFRPSRLAARGALGAVMGSKGVKAVLVKRNGPYRQRGRDSEAFSAARKAFNDTVRGSERTAVLAKYGTAGTLMVVEKLAALPTRNFSQGRFEHAEDISGEALLALITARGGAGRNSHPCMAGCLIRCSNVIPDAAGAEAVAPLEYETLCLMGSNLGLGDLDAIARLNRLANDFGVDTIEVGATLGVMAEAGLVAFGDAEGFARIVEELPRGSLLGRVAGNGCALAGRLLGVRRVPAVKNQACSAYDPRGVKGTGVTYATSPMGADHTAGLTVFAKVDHHDREGQLALSRSVQVSRAAYDALGLCVFLQSAVGGQPGLVVDLLRSLWGIELPADYLTVLGSEVLADEGRFNRAEGLGPETDRLPEFMETEALPPLGLTWDIPRAELAALLDGLAQKGE